MLSDRRAAVWWGLALTLTVHALLWWVFSRTGSSRQTLAEPRPPVHVTLLPPSARTQPLPPPPSTLAPLAPSLPPLPDVAELELPPSSAKRDEIVYFTQDDLEQKVVVLKDDTAEEGIVAPPGVMMHLFIDAAGHVSFITFAGTAIGPALQEKLRASFMRIEFTPGIKDGKAVASRILIVLTDPAGND